MIFVKRARTGKILTYLRICKIITGNIGIESKNFNSTEWLYNINLPSFNSKEAAEKWLMENYEFVSEGDICGKYIYFMFNDTYAKVVYIREYPATATSEIFTDLLATGIEVMITTNIETYDSAAARKLVQHQITAIDTDTAKREVKAAQHGNFSSQMPQRIKNQRDSMVNVFDKITMKDQDAFIGVITNCEQRHINADSEEFERYALSCINAHSENRDNVIVSKSVIEGSGYDENFATGRC